MFIYGRDTNCLKVPPIPFVYFTVDKFKVFLKFVEFLVMGNGQFSEKSAKMGKWEFGVSFALELGKILRNRFLIPCLWD